MNFKNKRFVTILLIFLMISTMPVYAKKQSNTFHVPIIPQKGVYISSPFGYRIHPISGKRSMHYGVDIAAPQGTLVHAIADGEVIMATGNGSAGNEIRIRHKNGMVTRNLHMSKRTVKKGDKVKRGQVIGTVGSTGRSTGPHLHFEISINGKTINPMSIIGR